MSRYAQGTATEVLPIENTAKWIGDALCPYEQQFWCYDVRRRVWRKATLDEGPRRRFLVLCSFEEAQARYQAEAGQSAGVA